jgi:hypothetical protein
LKRRHNQQSPATGNTLQPVGGLSYGPFASLCNAKTAADVNHGFLSKLYRYRAEIIENHQASYRYRAEIIEKNHQAFSANDSEN